MSSGVLTKRMVKVVIMDMGIECPVRLMYGGPKVVERSRYHRYRVLSLQSPVDRRTRVSVGVDPLFSSKKVSVGGCLNYQRVKFYLELSK